jgi:ATP-dependent RNA circularization protein (DNA/RNA ligase family)
LSHHGSIIVFELKRGATEGTKYVRMLYLTNQFSGLGSGTLTYMKGAETKTMMGFPTQPLMHNQPATAFAAVGYYANESKIADP